MRMGKTLNGNVMCSIGLRTTGSDPKEDDIYHMCVLPLDLNYNPVFGQMFEKFVRVRPHNESKVSVEARVFSRKHTEVWDQFDFWFEETIKKGQIIPLVYDWPLTREFLRAFMSDAGVRLAFVEKARDIKVIANYMNDLHEADEKQVPFAKTTLRYILGNCEERLDAKYSAIHQAVRIAKSYQKMLHYPF